MTEVNERTDQFRDYQIKLTELLSMNPFIKELEEQAKTIELLRHRIDQLELSKNNQSEHETTAAILSSQSNYQSSNHSVLTDNDLKDDVKSLRERVFELEADLLIQNKDSQAQKLKIERLQKENDEIKQQISNILDMVSKPRSPLKEFVKQTIEEVDEKEFHSNKPISSDVEYTDDDDVKYIKSTREPSPPLYQKSRKNIMTRDFQIPISSYHSDQTKDESVPMKTSPLSPTIPVFTSTGRRFENLLPEGPKTGFYNNSQYIPSQIHRRSRSETRSSIPIVPPKRPQIYPKFTSNNSSPTSSQSENDFVKSSNNFISDDYDSEDIEYVGEQNIMENSSNIETCMIESSTSHGDLCKCNKCVTAQLREIEFYQNKMRANK
ncbi:871_t:CDS:2 [Scutellospora calospora]|uniref:871_t:CDS:1 n=1 Tax=Scutellospora calospora TaxID=85575 RepID=A0ACA9LHQ7_9GLOM|nr:871_t:CDS:2 [Scutellospora calospora]